MKNLKLHKTWNLFFLHSFIFFIAHFLLLLNSGAYWDDYSIIGTDILGIKERHFAAGLPFVYSLHAVVLWVHHTAWFYHFLVFVFYWIANWYLIKLAQRLFNFDIVQTLFFLFILNTVCFNTNKILVSCFHYTISYVAASYVLYHLYMGLPNSSVTKKTWLFLLSLLAFTTPSFLFYLPVVYFLLLFRKEIIAANDTSLLSKTTFNLFIITFKRIEKIFFVYYAAALLLFFTIKKIFPLKFPYADYNQISFDKVSVVAQNTSSLKHKILGRIVSIVNEINIFSGFSLCVAGVVTLIFLCIMYKLKVEKETVRNNRITFLANGIVFAGILFAAVFPYILVHKMPTFSEFGNRHQLLIPFGFSLLAVSFLSIFKSKVFKILAVATLIFIQTFLLSSFFVKYQIAEFRDIYLMNQLKLHQQELKKGIILFKNTASATNEVVSMEFIRHYALSGLYRQATGKQDILFVAPQELSFLKGNSSYVINLSTMLRDSENLKNYKPTDCVVGTITFGTKQNINTKVLLNWLWLKSFHTDERLAINLDKYFNFSYQSKHKFDYSCLID